MADPYGGMVPYRPNRKYPPVPARAPDPYGGRLPFRPGRVAADLEYEAAAAKRRGGRSAYGPAVMTPQTNTSVRPTVMTPQTSAVMQRLSGRPLNMAQFTAPVGGRKDPDGAQLDQFARANALLEGSQYLADTAGIREPGTYVTPRRRPANAPNLTYQNSMRTPLTSAMNPAPGPYANMRSGGGLQLGGNTPSPGLARALGMEQATGPAPAAPAYFNPKSPVYTPEQLAQSAQAGYDASLEVERRSTRGTTAIPDMERRIGIDGVPISGLRGAPQDMADRTLVGGARVLEPYKRQAYLEGVAADQAGRNKLVMAKAQRRTTERMDRIAASKREPTPLEQMAQRNPGLALAMAQMQQRGKLASDDNALRRELGLGELDVRRGGQEKQYDLGMAQGADRRYVADKDVEGKKAIAAGEREDAALAAAAGMGMPEARNALRQRLAPGAGVMQSDAGLSLPELPAEQIQSLDQASPAEAKKALENMGASPSSISSYLRQRQKEYDTMRQRQTLAVNAGSFINPGLMVGNLAARIQGMFDAPPVGVHPDVVARLTPEQRRRIGIPEPKQHAPQSPRRTYGLMGGGIGG